MRFRKPCENERTRKAWSLSTPPPTRVLPKNTPRLYYERPLARTKGTTQVRARGVSSRGSPLYFASWMVGRGHCRWQRRRRVNSTAETVRAARHAVGAASARTAGSSVFIMATAGRKARGTTTERGRSTICAVVVEPTADAGSPIFRPSPNAVKVRACSSYRAPRALDSASPPRGSGKGPDGE